LIPIIPPIITLAAAMALMILVALHARHTSRSDEPASRKRIRLANACLIMFTLPLVAIGFSVLDPKTHPRAWMLVWIAAMAFLAMNIALAFLDVLNTMRLVRAARRRLQAELIENQRADPP
jgi:biotin transporter BioY